MILLTGNSLNFTETYRQNESRSRLNRVIDYIHNHYYEELSLKKLSEIACLSRFHFHRQFHHLFSETPNEFIRRFRLEKALHTLMLTPQKPITDVALECGFSSSQNFSRSFKKNFGIPPSITRDFFNWDGIATMLKNAQNGRHETENLLFVETFLKSRGLTLPDLLEEKDVLVEIKKLPPTRVAYIRTIGGYTYDAVKPAFHQLTQWALPRHIITDTTFFRGVAWNNSDLTPKEKLIYDVCIEIPDTVKADKWVSVQTLPGGTYAVYHSIADIKRHENQTEFVTLLKWLLLSDYRPGYLPFYNIYLNRADLYLQGHAAINICIPVTTV